MVQVEVRGIPVSFDDSALDDFRMLRLLARIKDNDVLALPEFAERVFGAEQLENIMRSLEDDDGVCRLTDMVPFIFEAMDEAAKERAAESKN